jgi:hypothetical protein
MEDLIMVAVVYSPGQLPLIEFVESDDLFLQDEPDALWFDVLRKLDYRQFQPTAARYYEQLWQFNQQQTRQRNERRENPPAANPETQQQATARLLFDRPTLDENAPVLYQLPPGETPSISIRPETLLPGVTPPRFAGRPPKCFFAMFKAFLGVTLARQPAEPQFVHQKLRENPAFARTCGFTIPRVDKPERQSDIPSLRKLQQFDQIMTKNGLWSEAALDRVAANLRDGAVQVESTLVHDTTHYLACSSMQVIDRPDSPACDEGVPEPAAGDLTALIAKKSADRLADGQGGHATGVPELTQSAAGWSAAAAKARSDSPAAAKAAQTLEKPEKTTAGNKSAKPSKKSKRSKKKRKSHPRTTKACRCKDRDHCDHEWINADDGVGTVVKSTGKMYWGHKASTLGFPRQEVLLDAVPMSDAASHDSQSLLPHLNRLFQRHPDLNGIINRVLDDGAADDAKLKAAIKEDLGIEVLAPINPRRRGPIRDDMPRGIDHLTPRGVPVCRAGYPFELVGVRHDTEHFLFRAPKDEQGQWVCQGCGLRVGCYRGQSGGRQVTIPQSRLPWLDPEFPQLSKRFLKAMARRTSIERLHKLMKFDLGDDRLTKRGNDAFQARLDKTLFAMHVLLAYKA